MPSFPPSGNQTFIHAALLSEQTQVHAIFVDPPLACAILT
jgi:hypothetical protein